MKLLLLSPAIFGLAFYSANSISQTQDEKTGSKTQEQSTLEPVVQAAMQSGSTVAQADAPIPPAMTGIIPARTQVKFFLGSFITTKTALPGQQFQLTVAEDVRIDNVTLIPMGTPATGEIIHSQKAKGFGKAGELSMTIRFIDLNGQKIKMRSFQPYQGKDNSNTAMTVSMIPYLGLFAGFAQGGNIEIPAQTLMQALITSDTAIGATNAAAATNTIDSNTSTTNTINTINGESQ
ncbi:MAG: hypothetical protein ACREO1_06885 [Arenimonas sp.]